MSSATRTVRLVFEAPSDAKKISMATVLEARRAYRLVGPMTAAHVAVALPTHLLRLYWRDKIRGGQP